jgi:hypothetical protein
VIAPDPQAPPNDLCRQMAIAEMPGDPHHLTLVIRANFHKRLGRCDDFDQPAVFENQCVAATQGNRLREIEQKLQTAGRRDRHATAMTVVESKDHGIGDLAFP